MTPVEMHTNANIRREIRNNLTRPQQAQQGTHSCKCAWGLSEYRKSQQNTV